MIKLFRLLLLPVSLVYSIVMRIRNILFDKEFFHSESFPFPVITIGNLVVGGTGKTPMTEYLIKLLKDDFKIATLSRGYGRRTKGFVIASPHVKSLLVGDEPKQYKQKFPDVTVAVCEKRAVGIRALIQNYHLQLILLDDAYQHRSVRAGMNILLIEYAAVYTIDFMLPAGNLREPKSGKKRADIIVISKCKKDITEDERVKIKAYLRLDEHQTLYFSYIQYGDIMMYDLDATATPRDSVMLDLSTYHILLITGIAKPMVLLNHLKTICPAIDELFFPDHHNFSGKDVIKIAKNFNNIPNAKKVILTTEKDLMRFTDMPRELLGMMTPIYYVPITTVFIPDDETLFNDQIVTYVRNNTTNS